MGESMQEIRTELAWDRLVRVVLLAVALILPFRVLAAGWMPVDDALRHAAKVVSGQPWSELLVLRPEIRVDSHPGWHRLLGWVREAGIATPRGLVIFEVVALSTLFVGSGALLFRRPEAWILALFVLNLFDPGNFARLFFGRPLLITMTVVVVFGRFWRRLDEPRLHPGWWILFAALAALSTWLHGTWYLLALPVVALAASRRWLAAVRLAGATLTGIAIGLALTGSPFASAVQTVRQLLWTFAAGAPESSLVTEFRPWNGSPLLVLAVVAMLGWRMLRSGWRREVVDNPVFLLAAMGWIAGFSVLRFWSDWGVPALCVWMTVEFEQALERAPSPVARRRALAVLGLAAVFLLVASADYGGRWSKSRGRATYFDAKDPRLAGWLPGPGGVLFNTGMTEFYGIFFENPRAGIRYMIGFEPTWMPEPELRDYRRLVVEGIDARTLRPWVARMRPQDRLCLLMRDPPSLPGLEWLEVRPGLWLARRASGEAGSAAAGESRPRRRGAAPEEGEAGAVDDGQDPAGEPFG